ncbi:MAG: hypothetical protein DCF21_02365 [Leptolyngbya sp.]|jgi:hypothetical protein|nr:MAG: hypothetical protein DCF21_02365 [Leptolyngbya sp.]
MTYTPCQRIADTLGDLFTCEEVNGFTRIRTPYLYPDGDVIDLFYRVSQDRPIVTDLGETLRWLLSQTTSEFLSKKQEQAIQDILLTHDVELYRGSLVVRVGATESLASATMRLAQATIAVSNLWFLSRTRVASSLEDEIAELLQEKKVRFEANEKLGGRSGRTWRIAFHTWHPDHSSLVQVLSTGSRAAANTKANNVVAAWVDLSQLKVGTQPLRFISLFDDTLDVWNVETIRQLEELSDIAYWSEPNRFVEMLTSADRG